MKKAFFIVIEGDDDTIPLVTESEIHDVLTDPFYGMGQDVKYVDVMPARNLRAVPKEQDAEEFFRQLDA